MPPLKLTTDSFVFNNSPLKRPATRKINAHKKKKAATTKATRSHHLLSTPALSSSLATNTAAEEVIRQTPEIAHLLQGRTIYIEKKLHEYARLKDMAEAMGASVKETLDKYVTDYITDLKSGKKQLGVTSNKGNRCVSPLWLITCYQQQKYLPPINFPIDLQPHINTFPAAAPPTATATAAASAAASADIETPVQQHNLDDNDNPFGLEEVDYDYLEANKPGNQLKMDRFITRENRATRDENSDVMCSMSEAETIGLQEDVLSEEDDGRQEFFYNHSSDNSNRTKRREETAEEIEARNKRNNAIRLTLSKARSASSSATSSTRAVTRSSSQKETSTGFFGQQKFSVWYGEQEFKHVASNKRS